MTDRNHKKSAAVLYDCRTMALDRLLAHFRAGDQSDDQENAVTAERLASELIGKYRALGCCLDRNGVSYDGPMIVDIVTALRAAHDRGRKAGGES